MQPETVSTECVEGRCLAAAAAAGFWGAQETAETLIDRTAMTAGKKARRALQKARPLLKHAGAKATHAARGKKAKLSAACAAALKDAAGRVAAGLLYRTRSRWITATRLGWRG